MAITYSMYELINTGINFYMPSARYLMSIKLSRNIINLYHTMEIIG